MRGALGLIFAGCLLLPACGKASSSGRGLSPEGSAGVGGASDAGSGAGGADSVAVGGGDSPLDDGAGAPSSLADGGSAGEPGVGEAGAGGGPASVRADGCVDLSHFEDSMRERWDLHVVGTGFDADEGSRVRIIVTLGEPSYGLVETTIENGGFSVTLSEATEPYTGMAVYIDRGRNDRCDIDEDTWFTHTSGGVYGEHTWAITPNTQPPSGESPCYLNGIFDLATTLACPVPTTARRE